MGNCRHFPRSFSMSCMQKGSLFQEQMSNSCTVVNALHVYGRVSRNSLFCI